MTATILPFPSCCFPQCSSYQRLESTAPSGHFIKIVGLDAAVRDGENAFHDLGARNDRLLRTLDLTYVRLAAAELGGEPLLGPPLLLPPHRQFQRSRSRLRTGSYCRSLYFVNGHKQSTGSEYKHMAYVYAMHPGNRIRELRKRAGLSQIQLAERSGVSQPAISQLENDGLSLTVEWMRTFARIFGVTPADILGDQDNPDRLSDEERDLLARFRDAADSQRELIRRVAEPIVSLTTQPHRDAA